MELSPVLPRLPESACAAPGCCRTSAVTSLPHHQAVATRRTAMESPLWALIALALIAALVLVIWSIRRHRSPILHVECDATIDKLMPSLSGLSLSTSVDGNRVEVLQNGAFFDTLIERIRAARKTVHFETFLWKPGALSQRMFEAFADRARAGVKVRIILDAQGSKKIEADMVQRL